jgi:hypothetical protein
MSISLICCRPARTMWLLGLEIGEWGYFLALSWVTGTRFYRYRILL